MIEDNIGITLSEVSESFGLGLPVSWEHLKNGNINQTYRVDVITKKGKRAYILQKLNSNAFKTPQKNVENHALITKHLREKLKNDPDISRKTVKLYKTAEGGYLYTDIKGDYWRAMTYIYGAVSVNKPDDLIMRRTGEAFGTFQSLLSDCPIALLHETISGFHDTEKRMEALAQSAKNDKCGRLSEIKNEYDLLMSFPAYASFFRKEYDEGRIPLRVTHNDTKCNNVMFDEKTFEPLAIIDLDTVMPGFAAHDFGDALRFGANIADEDEEDLSKVGFDMDMFRAFAEGYIPKVKDSFGTYELETLPYGVIAMTLECAARFLTDYLDGDVYFITRKDKHNLHRAKCQAALLKDELSRFNEMKAVVREICSGNVMRRTTYSEPLSLKMHV
ncbi:MAG: aminoglycoside phosphotransferase family protein [Eubacteriales bacterium]|nr:aminoglycoside phosphotransferase family protein [Eubacteriales bacterium]